MPKYKKETVRSNGKWQGMNWIRQSKRLAIYLRDGLSCMYCGESIEDGVKLTLDHVVPHSKGGSNHENNLITCCEKCNKSRQNRKVKTFAKAVAKYVDTGITAEDIMKDINKHLERDLEQYHKEAKDMIARRGSAFKAINALK